MFHFDCYFNVLILMGPSCRNPWAHFQFYRNVELIIMEAYNLRAGMTFVVIRSSSDILEVSKSWMISSSPSVAYWNLAPELRPVTANPSHIPASHICISHADGSTSPGLRIPKSSCVGAPGALPHLALCPGCLPLRGWGLGKHI